jgi:hypothetical protein
LRQGGEDVPVIRDLDKKVIKRRFSGVTGDFFEKFSYAYYEDHTSTQIFPIPTIKIVYL